MAHALFFGPVGEVMGSAERSVPDGCGTVQEAIDALAIEVPALDRHLDHLRFAINGAFVTLDHTLQPNDELSILSPVSGG